MVICGGPRRPSQRQVKNGALVILSLADVLVAVGLSVGSLPAPLAILVPTDVVVAIGPSVGSLRVELVILVLTDVLVAAGKSGCSKTVVKIARCWASRQSTLPRCSRRMVKISI